MTRYPSTMRSEVPDRGECGGLALAGKPGGRGERRANRFRTLEIRARAELVSDDGYGFADKMRGATRATSTCAPWTNPARLATS